MPPAGAEACARKARTGSIKIALAPPSALACMKFLRVMVSFIFISISRESFLQFGLQGLVLGHGPIGSFRETADRRPTPPAAPQPDPSCIQFRGSATEVIVPVTVTDDKGRFVSNLVKKDFRVLDEGKPQN